MSAPSVASRAVSPPPGLPIYRFTPDQFQQLIASDVLSPDLSVEFHDGQVFVRNNGTLPPLQFTVAQYQRMITLGILLEGAPIELLEGWIVTKMARNPPHDTTIYRTQMALIRRLPPEWICRGQSGVTTDDSQPEPDLAVVRGPIDRYDDHHPTPRGNRSHCGGCKYLSTTGSQFQGPPICESRNFGLLDRESD
jgi:hypothetical protein